MPDRAVFSSETYDAYKKVNEVFAASTIKALKRSVEKLDEEGKTDVVPLVWIHDYQLMLAASLVRKVSEFSLICNFVGFLFYLPDFRN